MKNSLDKIALSLVLAIPALAFPQTTIQKIKSEFESGGRLTDRFLLLAFNRLPCDQACHD